MVATGFRSRTSEASLPSTSPRDESQISLLHCGLAATDR